MKFGDVMQAQDVMIAATRLNVRRVQNSCMPKAVHGTMCGSPVECLYKAV